MIYLSAETTSLTIYQSLDVLLTYTVRFERYTGEVQEFSLSPISANDRFSRFNITGFTSLAQGQHNLQILLGDSLLYTEDVEVARDFVTYDEPNLVISYESPSDAVEGIGSMEIGTTFIIA